MAESEKRDEQRKHKRFRVQDGAFVMLKGPVRKLGQIIDISRGGLAFRYIDIGDRPKRSFELDITIDSIGFRLESISFNTVYDFKAVKEFPFSSTRMRRCGGQFSRLTDQQMSDLEYFIQNHTLGEA